MIIITVEVPIMEVRLDFQVDEDVPFSLIRDEIAEMVSRKNQCAIEGEISDIILWDKRTRRIIDLNKTSFENNLKTGSELVMA